MEPALSIPPPSPREPLWARIVGTLSAASLATLLASLSWVLRSGGLGDAAAFFALALGPAVLLVTLLVLAVRGARPFEGRPLLLHLAIVFVLVFDVGAILGSLLARTTHHHVLAGVTFSLALLAVVLGAFPFTRRMARALSRGSQIRALPSVVVIVLLALVGSHHASTLFKSPSGTIAFDLLALTVAAAFAATLRHERVLRVFLPIALGIAVFGALHLRGHFPYATDRRISQSSDERAS